MMRAAHLALLTTFAFIAACGAEGPGPAGTTSATAPTDRTPTRAAAEELLPVAGTVTLFGADAEDNLGTIATGDFNGDGVKDALVGAAFADGPENARADAGEVYVFLGPFSPGESRDAATRDHDLIVYGAEEGDQAGRAIAAGDFSGDGIDDIFIGAPFADGPDNTRDSAGDVYVILGSPSLGAEVTSLDLADGIADVSIYGADPSGFTGLSIAAANLNGDPFADLVIGSFWADGPDGDRPQAGEVYTVFGSEERRSVDIAGGEQNATVYGARAGDRLGETVEAGDVNADGIDDLVLAAPFAATRSGEDAGGRVYVVLSPVEGGVDLAEQPVESVIFGVDAGDQLGHAAAVGDIDGDRREDLLLTSVSSDGFENTSTLAGEAAVVLAGSLRPQVDLARGEGAAVIYGAQAGDRLGRSAALGDLDSDGRADILLGAPDAMAPRGDAALAGALYLVPAAQLAETVMLPEHSLVLHGEDAGDSLSSAVYGRRPTVIDDLNGDGLPEVLVAAPRAAGPANARPAAGEAYILFLDLP